MQGGKDKGGEASELAGFVASIASVVPVEEDRPGDKAEKLTGLAQSGEGLLALVPRHNLLCGFLNDMATLAVEAERPAYLVEKLDRQV